MNETLYALEQKSAVELDIQTLYETLQKEINEQKDMRENQNLLYLFINLIKLKLTINLR